MVGQKDVKVMWNHIGKVAYEDSFETVLEKIERALRCWIYVTKLTEDEVQSLSIKKKKKAVRVDCETCTQPTHGEGDCPAKESECFGCGRTGHFKGSKACKKKKGSKDDDKKRKKS